MRREDFELLTQLEEKFWWFVAMRRITDTILARELTHNAGLTILDAGCGTGFNVVYYSKSGRNDVFGIDISADAIEGAQRRGLTRLCRASLGELPFPENCFDLVISLDAISHVSIDIMNASVREIYRVLKPGGGVFVRFAAFEWLRSSHDADMNTTRRFTLPEVQRLLTSSGFAVSWSSYANCYLFPVVVVRRILKAVGIGRGTDVRPFPGWLQWLDPLLRNIMSREATIFRAGGRLPFGVSIICFARK